MLWISVTAALVSDSLPMALFTQLDEEVQAGESQARQASNAASGSATPVSEAADDAAKGPQSGSAGVADNATEQGYTDTIQSLLSELWKERLVRLLICIRCINMLPACYVIVTVCCNSGMDVAT